MEGRNMAETLYDSKVVPRLTEICHWVRCGATDKDVADNLKIPPTTIGLAKREHPEFAAMLKEARTQQVHKVESALFKRATGYDYTELRTVMNDAGPGSTTVTTKHQPADVCAAVYWLNNREKDFWKSRQEVGVDDSRPQSLADAIIARRRSFLNEEN